MIFSNLTDLHDALRSGKTTCVQLVHDALARADAAKDLNAFVEVFPESALAKAKQVDASLASGTAGPLAGMVMAIKDNLSYAGHAMSASSKILNNYTSPYTATAVQRLLDADAIILGRTGCDEFAMGSSNETSFHGPVKNPVDPTKTPGGSSGGSASAVGASIVQAALGTDTGGSIRQPAAFCGIYGSKPTYGRVSRYGAVAYASSFDQIGPLARSLEDMAAITQVIAGEDVMDGTCSDRAVPEMFKPPQAKPMTFGYYPAVVDNPSLDPEIQSHFNRLKGELEAAGHQMKPLAFDHLDSLVPIYYILTTAEASANLSRYDGMRYGHRAEGTEGLEDMYKSSRSEGFGAEVKRRIMLGTFVLSAGYFDAYYAKAQKARRVVRDATLSDLQGVDAIIGPTTPHTAFEIGLEHKDPTALYLEDIFTVQAPIAGIPALSIPAGTHSNGLPYGWQIMVDAFEDDKLFTMAMVMEAAQA